MRRNQRLTRSAMRRRQAKAKRRALRKLWSPKAAVRARQRRASRITKRQGVTSLG